MTVKEIDTARKQPIIPTYCRECRSHNTFDRYPEGDIKGEDTGKVLWEKWRCSECGNTRIYPVTSGE